ncbi:hypothetical protein HYQ44_016134 [Verticillium longisporum]|nr:hypothetical protein HYQ44_016134 [Verticillium longisporum]
MARCASSVTAKTRRLRGGGTQRRKTRGRLGWIIALYMKASYRAVASLAMPSLDPTLKGTTRRSAPEPSSTHWGI